MGAPTPFQVSGVYYDVKTSATFSGQVKVTLPYNPSQGTPVILHYNGTSWVALVSTVNTANDTVSAMVSSLSPFAVGLDETAASTTSPLPDGTYGSPCSQTLAASGGNGGTAGRSALGTCRRPLPGSGQRHDQRHTHGRGSSSFTVQVSDNLGVTSTEALMLLIDPAPLTITASNQSKNFGTTLSFAGTEFAASQLYGSDAVSSVTLTSSAAAASAIPGTYPITPSAAVGSGLGNYTITYKPGTLTVVPAPTAVALRVTPAQYSDVSTFTATASPASAGGSQLSGTVQFAVGGTKVGSPVAINAGGVATYNYTVTSPQGSYPVTATFSASVSSNANFANPATAASATLVVSPEDAAIAYTGDTLGTVGSALNLQATVMDSAAAGYGGLNPETSAAKTIGDITKMWVAFTITPVGSSAPTTVYAPVLDTGTLGDGIGTATATYKAAAEGSCTVLAQLVAGATGGANQYYASPDAQPATLSFYTSSGEFASGAGWIKDPATLSHGMFAFIARYNSAGKASGQFAYVWSGTYGGLPAFFTVTSNALTALGFSGSSYPLSATLSGTATLQVNKASNFALLYGPESKLPFTVTAYDTGKSSGVGLDKLSLTLTGSKASFLTGGMKSFSGVALGGGNIVIHLK